MNCEYGNCQHRATHTVNGSGCCVQHLEGLRISDAFDQRDTVKCLATRGYLTMDQLSPEGAKLTNLPAILPKVQVRPTFVKPLTPPQKGDQMHPKRVFKIPDTPPKPDDFKGVCFHCGDGGKNIRGLCVNCYSAAYRQGLADKVCLPPVKGRAARGRLPDWVDDPRDLPAVGVVAAEEREEIELPPLFVPDTSPVLTVSKQEIDHMAESAETAHLEKYRAQEEAQQLRGRIEILERELYHAREEVRGLKEQAVRGGLAEDWAAQLWAELGEEVWLRVVTARKALDLDRALTRYKEALLLLDDSDLDRAVEEAQRRLRAVERRLRAVESVREEMLDLRGLPF